MLILCETVGMKVCLLLFSVVSFAYCVSVAFSLSLQPRIYFPSILPPPPIFCLCCSSDDCLFCFYQWSQSDVLVQDVQCPTTNYCCRNTIKNHPPFILSPSSVLLFSLSSFLPLTIAARHAHDTLTQRNNLSIF